MKKLTSFPAGWKKTTLGKIIKLTSGTAKPKNISSPQNGELYPVFGGNGILGYSSEYNSEGPEIIIGRVGEKCGCVHFHSSQCWVTDNALKIQAVYTEIYHNFIAEALRYARLVEYRAKGGQPLITQSSINLVPILLPPLPEQKAIADLLSTWDAAIEKTERLIRAKEIRLEAYGTMLFDHKDIKKRHDWKFVKLKDILTEHKEKSTGIEDVFSVSVHKGLVNQVEHLGRSFAASNTYNYNRVHHGDIVYTKSPTGDFPFGVVKQSNSVKDVIVSPLYGVFTPENFEMGMIIDFYFSSPTRTSNYLYPIIQKGAKNTIAITNQTFLSNLIPLPRYEEVQKSTSIFIATAKEEINLQKKMLGMYKLQKRGLMQRLLTGEWRVKSEIISLYKL